MYRKRVIEGELVLEKSNFFNPYNFYGFRNLSQELQTLVEIKLECIEKLRLVTELEKTASINVSKDIGRIKSLADNTTDCWYYRKEPSLFYKEQTEKQKTSEENKNNQAKKQQTYTQKNNSTKKIKNKTCKEYSLLELLCRAKIAMH